MEHLGKVVKGMWPDPGDFNFIRDVDKGKRSTVEHVLNLAMKGIRLDSFLKDGEVCNVIFVTKKLRKCLFYYCLGVGWTTGSCESGGGWILERSIGSGRSVEAR